MGNLIHILWAWPNGITTGNLIASLIWAVVAVATVTIFRDHIGKHVAKWWHKHSGEHHIAHHLEALRRFEEERRDHND